MHRTKTYKKNALVVLAAMAVALLVFPPSSLQSADIKISAMMKLSDSPPTISHGDIVKPEPTATGFVDRATKAWDKISERKILTGKPVALQTPRRMTGEWTIGPFFGSSPAGLRGPTEVGLQVRVAF